MALPAPAPAAAAVPYTRNRSERSRIIVAVVTGTTIEWYDFYLYSALLFVMTEQFFPKGDATAALLAALALHLTGFIIRPVGALFFGRLGDLHGRKRAFFATLLLMGAATTAIAFLPTYDQIGLAAPFLLVVFRLAQGFALGGEYGGAATFIAENVPDAERGFYTSFVQVTATLGFFLSLVVLLGIRNGMGEAAFQEWGWRFAWVASLFLLGISMYVRLRLQESPLWERLRAERRLSPDPVLESFSGSNGRKMLVALFGATAGQGVVWYTAQFYAFVWMQNTLKVPGPTASVVVAVALLCAMPFFVVVGQLSDLIGRKKLIVLGNLLAAVTFFPLFRAMATAAHPLNPVLLTFLVFLMVLLVTLVYGPIAALLVELFPGRVRYTAASLPYHLGNGWFGGSVPLVANYVVARTGNIYSGLLFPITVAALSGLVGLIWLRESRETRIWAEVLQRRTPTGSTPRV
ncbi:MAG TPA: MFS transporter [Myxococcaceae bacterium]|nr:MFS transporter [Myxococcaceae bacterium]